MRPAGRFAAIAPIVPVLLAAALGAAEPYVQIEIGNHLPGPKISPTLWGIFFEDINFAADGGLYAEMVKNGGFEFPDPLMGWEKRPENGVVRVMDADPAFKAGPHYVRAHGVSLANGGFRGMGLREGERYVFSVWARKVDMDDVSITASLMRGSDAHIADATVRGFTSEWRRHEATLTVQETVARPELVSLKVRVEGRGDLDLDRVSLFPATTWKGRPGGLRADLVQMLADLKPGFVRFPGGCIVEGRTLATRYRWKDTIGPREERKLLINRWNDEFKHRPAPDYFQSFGLGFFEFFQLCEDIRAEPLPILNCGMACQFNSGELAPLDALDPYIQDAVDLIEFANGPAESPWGAKRAAMGHPAPFGMKMLGIGNEQWGPGYFERYERFAKVLKERHPRIKLVASAGPAPADDRFTLAWKELRRLKADIVDEHCYDRPDWFFANADRFLGYDRRGPKVFMGEYAAQSVKTVSPDNRSTWGCALAEAAFMTGLERNSDVVVMSSYAPLLGHAGAWQWRPNLIWFDDLRVFGTPSYYVQQLFARNRGYRTLSVTVTGTVDAMGARPYLTASQEEKSGDVILKAVNARPEAVRATISLTGAKPAGAATLTRLAGKPDDENSFEEPKKVAPVESTVTAAGSRLEVEFAPHSLTVLRIPVR